MTKFIKALFGKKLDSKEDSNTFAQIFFEQGPEKRMEILREAAHKANKDQRELVEKYKKKAHAAS